VLFSGCPVLDELLPVRDVSLVCPFPICMNWAARSFVYVQKFSSCSEEYGFILIAFVIFCAA
jgi:hypothetical protein